MEARKFVNHYEVLGLAIDASFAAIGQRFRHLARKYHPDNQVSGDARQFDAIVQAHDVLKDADKRTQYHNDNSEHLPPFIDLPEPDPVDPQSQADRLVGDLHIGGLGIDQDIAIQNNLLLLLYIRRRRNIREPGIGDAELEGLSGCPPEHLEFHIWYLKAKGWVATGEDGLLAITIDGVERAANLYRETATRLITDQS